VANLRSHIDESKAEKKAPKFAPGGQSTQVIVGADASSDQVIIESSAILYSSYRLRRVYYSAFSPIPDSSQKLPVKAAPLMREHRLYQADWLLRFYGFDSQEIFAHSDGMLDLEIDPKLAWALKHREQFPLDINQCSREQLLRVPGLGTKAVARIIAARSIQKVRLEDLQRLRVPIKRVLPFIKLPGHANSKALDSQKLQRMLRPEPAQLSFLPATNA
jgi:predicted DNA-binding helix-hairpin-helix protein